MKKLPLFKDQKFVMSIGDEGATLSFVSKNKLISKIFALSPAPSDRREINALLQKHPGVPIYVLLDTIEQTYIKQFLPAVSALSINKLVKKRMERDFAKTDIKGAVLLGRDLAGRKDWIYMFVSTPATPNVMEWLDYFSTLPNSFAGIYLLPIEMENVIKGLLKSLDDANLQKSKWQFIVTHNKTGGFRQTIINNGRVVFTRLVRQGKDSLPDIIAGNIEQEIINTIDYLRRLGLNDDEVIDIIIIVSKELKVSLANTKIRGKAINLLTPSDTAKLFNLPDIAGKDDKFSDVLLACIFAHSKPVLKLANPKAKALNAIATVYKLVYAATLAIVPSAMLYSAYIVFDLIKMNGTIKSIEDKKASIEKEWQTIQNTSEYNIDDANKITDAVQLHKKIRDSIKVPTEFLERYAGVKLSFVNLQSYTWSYDKNFTLPGHKPVVNSILNLDFSAKATNLDSMFKNYDALSAAINSKYTDCNIDISKLPEKITFDDKTDTIPIQIKLTLKDDAAAGTAPTAPAPSTEPANAGGSQ